MQKVVISGALFTLFTIIGILSAVVTDFHDRAWPVALGSQTKVTLDFSRVTMPQADAMKIITSADRDFSLSLVKKSPDLSNSHHQVFASLNANSQRDIEWFHQGRPSPVLGPDRLAHSFGDGEYYVGNATRLSDAIDFFTEYGILATTEEASRLTTMMQIVAEPGFAAPFVAAVILNAALSVYWLVSRARSRSLRVLAGQHPFAIHARDLQGFAILLLAVGCTVLALSCALVGLRSGWIFVPLFGTYALVLTGLASVIAMTVMGILSSVMWPSPELFAQRKPPASAYRRMSKMIQTAAFLALIGFSGPAWLAAQDSQRTAYQLSVWHRLSDAVALNFGLPQDQLTALEPDVYSLITEADSRGQAALSFTLPSRANTADHPSVSDVSIVNPTWIDIVSSPENRPSLTSLRESPHGDALLRVHGGQIAILKDSTGNSLQAALEPYDIVVNRAGSPLPIARGGSGTDLLFHEDMVVLQTRHISAAINARNATSLATSGNIIFRDLHQTQRMLTSSRLTPQGLASRGIDGKIHPVYIAETGLLRAQMAEYQARLLAASLAVLAYAFILASLINATISALLNARRDFPLRLSGARWEQVTRARAWRDVIIAAPVILLIVFLHRSSAGAAAVTCLTGVMSLAMLYAGHSIAARLVFHRVVNRAI